MMDQRHRLADMTPSPISARHIPAKGVAGIVLIIVGLLSLLTHFAQGGIDILILLAAGLIFLASGMIVRHAGLMIVGGILSGLGLGLLLVSRHVFPESASAGIIILALGAGFLVSSPLSMLFSNRTQHWSLIPGSILAVIGMLLLIGVLVSTYSAGQRACGLSS
jgi:hypothetical protein